MSKVAVVEYRPYKDGYPLNHGKVLIDGVEIHGVTAIESSVSVNSLPEVTIHLNAEYKYNDESVVNADLPIETLEQAFDCLRLYCRNNYYGVHDRLMDSIKTALDSPLDGDELAEQILYTMLEETELDDVFDHPDSGHEYT